MPIIRTYACPACNHWIEVVLTSEQWDDPEPDCPACKARTVQEFKPFGIGGSTNGKAHAVAESILASDYHVADFQREHRREGTPSVRYKDQATPVTPSQWGQATAAIEQAIAVGRQTRIKHGSGLDVLQANLASGAEPDLIAGSKRKSIRVW